tara:strand:- start:408 stop:662 length:255 start_codon:yes stop_codon:yes gene_type:complete
LREQFDPADVREWDVDGLDSGVSFGPFDQIAAAFDDTLSVSSMGFGFARWDRDHTFFIVATQVFCLGGIDHQREAWKTDDVCRF